MKYNKIDFHILYEEGKNDAEIAKKIGCAIETVRQWRLKNNLPSNFSYKNRSKTDLAKLEDLITKNIPDSKISNILKISKSTVYSFRKKLNLKRDNLSLGKNIIATDRQRSIIIGTLLGDSCLRIDKGCINPRLKCDHGSSQKDYCYYKYRLLKSLDLKFTKRKRKTPDARTGKLYTSYVMESKNNPYYLDIYNNMYINNKKRITEYILKDFNEESLAILFMDDGFKSSTSITIATDNFLKEDLVLFSKFLKNRFNLNFSITSKNRLYLKTKDFKLFVSIIFPYLLEDMYYKIGLNKI